MSLTLTWPWYLSAFLNRPDSLVTALLRVRPVQLPDCPMELPGPLPCDAAVQVLWNPLLPWGLPPLGSPLVDLILLSHP